MILTCVRWYVGYPKADVAALGVLEGHSFDLGALIGRSDEVLVDRKDHTLVKNGLFIAKVKDRLLACRAIKAHSNWSLSPDETIASDTLIDDYLILERIRLI